MQPGVASPERLSRRRRVTLDELREFMDDVPRMVAEAPHSSSLRVVAGEAEQPHRDTEWMVESGLAAAALRHRER